MILLNFNKLSFNIHIKSQEASHTGIKIPWGCIKYKVKNVDYDLMFPVTVKLLTKVNLKNMFFKQNYLWS